MPSKPRVAAVIDIGSNNLRLVVAQTVKPENISKTDRPAQQARGLKYLERLSYPLGLGRDTFHTGSMSFEKADKACEVIKNFLTVARGYGVKHIKTVASTAVREAENMDYILDQIKIKTGLSVQVIDDHEEKLYIYKMLTHYATEEEKQSALMVYIGAGNIGVSALSNGRVTVLNNIMAGSLRVDEMFGDIEEHTSEFYRLMEEFLATFTSPIARQLPEDISNFIVSGPEISVIAEMTEAKGSIPREKFVALYDDIKRKTAERIAEDYGIDGDRADVLLPAACIYQNLLNFTTARSITVSPLLPCDAVLYELLYPKAFTAINKQFAKNTLFSAKRLAARFHANEAHYTLVYAFALNIFDKMKRIHGLGARDKLLLQAAAVLHDTGKYVNYHRHYYHSYEIVRGSDIVGLNQLETEMVALLCLYHSQVTPSAAEPRYRALDAGTRVRVSKLAAILRIADALDRSHTQKFTQIAVKVNEGRLSVTVATDANISLEQWSFNEKGRFFEEVFGIKAVLKIKRDR